MNTPVDMVFTYIDGRDPAIMHKRQQCEILYNEEDIHHERAEGKTCDMLYNNVAEITYSVRSVIKYLPWIRTIFIVTDQQIPPVDPYLLDSGRVRIIDHKDIIPKKYLPIFNCEAIESCLYKIQGLSEIFLYNNDDCMHFSPVQAETFYTIIGNNCISLNLYSFPSLIKHTGHVISKFLPARWPISSLYVSEISNAFSLFRNAQYRLPWYNIVTPKHMTMTMRRSTALAIENKFSDALHQLRKQRFSTPEVISYITILYTMEKYWHPYDTIHNNLLFNSSIRFHFFEFKTFTDIRQSARLWKDVEDSPANFVCLNNIRECQYESFINVMKKKGLGDPLTTGLNGPAIPERERQCNV